METSHRWVPAAGGMGGGGAFRAAQTKKAASVIRAAFLDVRDDAKKTDLGSLPDFAGEEREHHLELRARNSGATESEACGGVVRVKAGLVAHGSSSIRA